MVCLFACMWEFIWLCGGVVVSVFCVKYDVLCTQDEAFLDELDQCVDYLLNNIALPYNKAQLYSHQHTHWPCEKSSEFNLCQKMRFNRFFFVMLWIKRYSQSCACVPFINGDRFFIFQPLDNIKSNMKNGYPDPPTLQLIRAKSHISRHTKTINC